MRVIVFGSSGMLGSYISRYLELKGHSVLKLTRKEFDIYSECSKSSLESSLSLLLLSHRPEYIINCAGVINKRSDLSISELYFVNSYFPTVLARLCIKHDVGLIHPTTDCVFSGRKGDYSKTDVPDCSDDYGLSKLLGEQFPFTPSTKLSVLRCSIIGEEFNTTPRSLLGWVQKNKNGSIHGFTDQIWNGITCFEYAKLVEKIITEKGWNGVYHIRSSFGKANKISKYELVKSISDVYKLNVEVLPSVSEHAHDRSLHADVVLQDIHTQLKEMRAFGVYMRKNIIRMPAPFKVVEGKDIVLVSSSIHAQSAYTPEERFIQTLNTIDKARVAIPDCKVVLVEMSKICDDWVLELANACDQVILCGDDKELQLCNSLGKSMGETTMTKLFFQNISDSTEMVYKISGRYWLTENFKTEDHLKDKFNFLPSDRCVHTTFYSIGKPHFRVLPDILSKIQQFVVHPANDIEHGYWAFVPQEDIHFLEKLNCKGTWSVNKTEYDA